MIDKIRKKRKLPGCFLPALCVLACLLGTGCARKQPDGNIISGEEAVKQAEEVQEDAPKEQDGSRMPPVADILMGNDYCIALCEDGSVWSWGNNESGKLGVDAGKAEVPQAVALPGSIIKIMDSGISIWALADNGDVYVWGKIRVSTELEREKYGRLFKHDIPLPMKVEDIPPMKEFSVRNNRLVALGYDGVPYMWGVTPQYSNWRSDIEPVYVKEEGDFQLPDGASVCIELERLPEECSGGTAAQVQYAEVGAGRNHCFIREDGTVFSVMRREGYEEGAFGFIFPNGNQEMREITYWMLDDLENIRILEGNPHDFDRAVVYYECENITDAERISADDYTMFLQKKDGSLWYWMSDRVTYLRLTNAQRHADGLEHGEGFFVPVDTASVLGMGESGAAPRIAAMCSNEENTLFLTDDGRLFVSSYVTDRVEDVWFYDMQNGAIGRIPSVQMLEDVPLKRIGFEKLDYQDIVSINCDGKYTFSAVDSAGNYYRINMLEKKLREMDFTAKQPHMDITSEENLLYLDAYLKVLKNEVTVDSWGNEFYYKDLWMAGEEFDELLAAKGQRKNPYLYYYDDLDGDGKPEFAIEQGCMYIFKYELEEDKVRVIHMEEACYFEKMVGTGQIWCHDGLHSGIVRDRLIVLNERNVWETVLSLEQTESPERDYYVVEIKGEDCADIGKESWDELLAPFFEMVENNELPRKTLEEVFGELLGHSDLQ